MADGKARVLVVEDNAQVRELLAAALAAAGYQVATAPDGVAGLAAALAAPPDLVLADLQMPRLDGAALCQRLMSTPRTRGVPVLIVTALPAAAAAARLANCPPDAVVHKPYDLDAVLRAVAEALAAAGE